MQGVLPLREGETGETGETGDRPPRRRGTGTGMGRHRREEAVAQGQQELGRLGTPSPATCTLGVW